MVATAFVGFGLVPIASAGEYSLNYFQGLFIIRKGEDTTQVSLEETVSKPPLYVAYRKNDAWAVWDDRGLTIRKGKRVFSTKLPEISTSPKLQTREQLVETVDLIKNGKRSTEARALSGSKRIGSEIYFLMRWMDSEGKTWLEALVGVNLDEEKPIPRLLGKFEGLSLASAEIDDKLMLHKDALGILTRKGEEWGESIYAPGGKVFSYRKLGYGLKNFKLVSGQTGEFVDTAKYGATLAGRIALTDGRRDELIETRGKVTLVGSSVALIENKGKAALRNLITGAEIGLEAGSHYRVAPQGLLVYYGDTRPTKAYLYNTSDWSVLASWKWS